MLAGMRVRYTSDFVRNAGGYDYEIASRRGTTVMVDGKDGRVVGCGMNLIFVQWDDEDGPLRVGQWALEDASKPSTFS